MKNFDIKNDPYELYNLIDDIHYQLIILKFKRQLIDELKKENRGIDWVNNDTLQIRKKGLLYSPYYPTIRQALS